jgi:hypothetical protein
MMKREGSFVLAKWWSEDRGSILVDTAGTTRLWQV